MSTAAWAPVDESAWTPVPEENPEVVAAANPPRPPTAPMYQTGLFGEQVAPLHIDPNAPVNTKVLNLNPWGGNFIANPTNYNEYERESGKTIGTVAGAMGASGLVPSGWGALGKYLVKPIVGGAGAGTGAAVGGATPSEAVETGGTVAAGEAILGGLGAAAKGILRSGMFGKGLANYFAEGTNGEFIPKTDETRDIQRVHEAMGIPKQYIRPASGMTSAADAHVMPARGVLKVTGLTPAEIEQMTPLQHGQIIDAALNKTGQAISKIAHEATERGVTINIDEPFTKAVGDLSGSTREETDFLQAQAEKIANDTADRLGIKDWTKATPLEVQQLRGAIYNKFPTQYRNQLYGPITRSLKEAVPEIVPEDMNFQDLKGAASAVSGKSGTISKYYSRASPTWSQQVLSAIKAHPILSTMASSMITGGGVDAIRGFAGIKSLYDAMKGK
jgi:hypothetical protein